MHFLKLTWQRKTFQSKAITTNSFWSTMFSVLLKYADDFDIAQILSTIIVFFFLPEKFFQMCLVGNFLVPKLYNFWFSTNCSELVSCWGIETVLIKFPGTWKDVLLVKTYEKMGMKLRVLTLWQILDSGWFSIDWSFVLLFTGRMIFSLSKRYALVMTAKDFHC